MNFRSITRDDVAELQRKVTIARAHAVEQKSFESLIELAKRQAEAAEACLLINEVSETNRLFSQSIETLEKVQDAELLTDFSERIGKVYSRAGKYSNASNYYLKTIKIRETLPLNTPENRTELSRLYKLCADTLMKTNHSEDAIALLTKCCDLMKQGYEKSFLQSDLEGWANSLYDLGGANGRYEAYDSSLKLYEEAVELYIKIEKDFKTDTRRQVANCFVNIGGIFESRRNFEVALEKYEKALEINRRLAVKDGDEPSLRHLAASCSHTAELYQTMGRLVEALSLFREKADVNQRLSKLKPIIEPPEILFLSPDEDFGHRLERLESGLPWYSLIFEMSEKPDRQEMYITYYTMGRLTEELARKSNDPNLFQEALRLFEASESILDMINAEFQEQGLEEKLREIKSCAKRIKNQINQGGNLNE